MSNTKSMIDEFDKLNVCATLDLDSISRSLYELIEYRKRIARELLKSVHFEDARKELKEVFLACDEKIKQLLGII